jgi:hypothetical protein
MGYKSETLAHYRKFSVRTCSQVLKFPYFFMLQASKFYTLRNTNAGSSLLQTLSLIFNGFGNTRMITGTTKSRTTGIINDINCNHLKIANNKSSYSINSPKQENALFVDLRNQEL